MDESDRSAKPPPPSLPYPGSLCHACGGCRYVRTAASVFVLCGVRADKYPRQPVEACSDFRAKS